MNFSAPAAGGRIVFTVLLLCATLCAQTPSLAAAHGHAHSAEHCCALCHAGPLPFLPAAVSMSPSPGLDLAWLPLSEHCGFVRVEPVATGPSRAPPSFSSAR